eukprot:GHVT01052011.1.p1 GENE.GHVT01052011.1~~GHVT01052011.1.p1  ORF type:complete len:343 (-),score=52.21 GHVT01052011.1:123-1151(-)
MKTASCPAVRSPRFGYASSFVCVSRVLGDISASRLNFLECSLAGSLAGASYVASLCSRRLFSDTVGCNDYSRSLESVRAWLGAGYRVRALLTRGATSSSYAEVAAHMGRRLIAELRDLAIPAAVGGMPLNGSSISPAGRWALRASSFAAALRDPAPPTTTNRKKLASPTATAIEFWPASPEASASLQVPKLVLDAATLLSLQDAADVQKRTRSHWDGSTRSAFAQGPRAQRPRHPPRHAQLKTRLHTENTNDHRTDQVTAGDHQQLKRDLPTGASHAIETALVEPHWSPYSRLSSLHLLPPRRGRQRWRRGGVRAATDEPRLRTKEKRRGNTAGRDANETII